MPHIRADYVVPVVGPRVVVVVGALDARARLRGRPCRVQGDARSNGRDQGEGENGHEKVSHVFPSYPAAGTRGG